jgi:murein DD-endopeptidase MepM/ murein hydrolase activator NlpD
MNKKLQNEIKRVSQLLKEGGKGENYLEDPVPMPDYRSNFGQWRQGGRWGPIGRPHKGDDIGVHTGTEVKSPWSGKIKVADINYQPKMCGGTIIIDHGNGYETTFCHMKRIDINSGDIVKKGQVVGLSGGDIKDIGRGNSTGDHLHWTLKKNGSSVDPMEYLKVEIPKGQYDDMSIIGATSSDLNQQKSDTDLSTYDKKEDEKLLEKIMGSQYLGMKVSDWVEVKKDPLKMLQFVFKLLDF